MSLHNVPRILVAAASSGSGKTLLTCGILEIFKKLNMNPVSYKCGPDYIDPMFHRNVLGLAGRNLDSFFSSDEELRRDVAAGKGGIAVIEGVMGLYDGTSADSDDGSCYSIAGALGAGIILVVDAKGAGRTLISIIKGILADDDKHLIKGIILNKMAGHYYDRFAPVLCDELKAIRADVSVIGYVPRLEGISLDSRHLGLKMPSEVEDIKTQIAVVAEAIEQCCDIQKIVDIAKNPLTDISRVVDITQKCDKSLVDIILAVARDDAFCFYYKENIELLESMGVKIVYFSPMADSKLPKADGLLLGGGYPELHLKELSANSTMLASIREAIANGMPSLAECGGFMYLHNGIKDKDTVYPMVGAIDCICSNRGHLVRFGYICLKAKSENIGHITGMKAHEFHYYDSEDSGDSCIAVKPDGSKQWECIISDGISVWGFPHLYYRSKPEFVQRFVKGMEDYHRKVLSNE